MVIIRRGKWHPLFCLPPVFAADLPQIPHQPRTGSPDRRRQCSLTTNVHLSAVQAPFAMRLSTHTCSNDISKGIVERTVRGPLRSRNGHVWSGY